MLWRALAVISIFNYSMTSSAKPLSIVGIHSYSEEFPWTSMLIQSFERQLEGKAVYKGFSQDQEIKFTVNHFFLKQKSRPERIFGVPNDEIEKIKKYIIQKNIQYAFVTDDYALTHMASWLCEKKVRTIFAGINGNYDSCFSRSLGKSFGGVLERYYLSDSIRLLKDLTGKSKLLVAVLLSDTPTGKIIESYAKEEFKSYSWLEYEIHRSSSFEKWEKVVSSKKYDGILPLQPYSLMEKDKIVDSRKAVGWIASKSSVPTVFTAGWHIECGGTLAITHIPEAQGFYAAKQLRSLLTNDEAVVLIPPHGGIEINRAKTRQLGLSIPFQLLSSSIIHDSIKQPCEVTKK